MDPLIANADAMRGNAALSPQRQDFTFYTYGDDKIPCQLYHTPGPETAEPSGLPTLFTLSLRRQDQPSATRDAREAQYTSDLAERNKSQEETESSPGSTPNSPASSTDFDDVEYDGDDESEPDLSLLPDPTMLFTHGRGSTLDNPTIVEFARGFARSAPILCFEQMGEMNDRVKAFRSLMDRYPSASAVGGRSKGARAACRASLYSPVRKLIFFTYPLIRGLDERFDELFALPADVDVLFIIGDLDALAPEVVLKSVRARMRARTWWIRLINADHAVWYERDEVRNSICNIAGQIAASWNAIDEHNPDLTELTIGYNPADGVERVEWTTWMEPPPEPIREPTQLHLSITGGGFPSGGGSINFNM